MIITLKDGSKKEYSEAKSVIDVAVVQYLDHAGAFLITKSGDKVSSYLGISKFTLYSYMGK